MARQTSVSRCGGRALKPDKDGITIGWSLHGFDVPYAALKCGFFHDADAFRYARIFWVFRLVGKLRSRYEVVD